MAEYLVLARKYRSATFEEVVGQEPIVQTLINAIESGRIAHAYLFTGTRGVGKTTMARILAKALNCLSSDAPTPKPCNKCNACLAIARGEDIDVVEIDGASNRGIDEVRELRANAIYRPSRCRYKIYYIDEVHMLTREAFNALLKTLEEPPGHVKFIFATTEPQKVPPTVLSRCQRFDFHNIPTALIAEHLTEICKGEKVKAETEALFRIAKSAAGSMRDGLSLLDQLLSAGEKIAAEDVIRIIGAPADEQMVAIATAIAEGDAASALAELAGTIESGVTLSVTANALGEIFRNMMLASTCGAESDLIELSDVQRKAVAQLAERFSTPALVHAVGIWQSVARNVHTSSLARGLLEAAIVRLAEAEKFVDPASLIERLEELSTAKPGGTTERKRTNTSARPMARPARQAQPTEPAKKQQPSELPPIQWERSWLSGNWQIVVAHLAARRKMQIAGALRLAEVVDFEGGALKLGFDANHETLRKRCIGPLAEPIAAALKSLAGMEIHCEFVPIKAATKGRGEQAARPQNQLSTEEKNGIMKDPAVRETLSLFGGDVVDICKDTTAVTQESNEGEDS